MHRRRLWFAAGCVAVIALGLASRTFPWLFPPVFGKYPGDALWAMMVLLGCAACQPQTSTRGLAASALTLSCLVEALQLYQAPWINTIRSTTLGHLVLGSTFSWMDIAAYAVGVALGIPIHRLILVRTTHGT